MMQNASDACKWRTLHGQKSVRSSPPTYPPTNARKLHPRNALSKQGKRRNPGFSWVSTSIRNAKGYLYELIIRWFRVQVPAAPLIFRGFRLIGNPFFVKCQRFPLAVSGG